jgi:tyrosinase
MQADSVLRPEVTFANVDALRDAYAKMQALPESDNRGWIYWAKYHGYDHNFCWHHGREGSTGFTYDLFLPWHRAYLVYWDNVTRDQNEDAILPWWDWTSPQSHETGIPEAYAVEEVDGAPNPLSSGPKPTIPNDPHPGNATVRDPGDPQDLPNGATPGLISMEDLLSLSDFVDFSEQIQNVHDAIHGWIGGDMGVIVASAFDPLFFAHHTMIDRLWYMWQVRHGVNNIPDSYVNYPLQGFDFRVRDVLDIGQLGYGYASSGAASSPGE